MVWTVVAALSCSTPRPPEGLRQGTAPTDGPIERTLTWDERHTWRLPPVPRGHLLEVEVAQRGVDVSLAVWDGTRRVAGPVERVAATGGRERLWVPPGRRSTWLQVQSQTEGEAGGTYELRVTSREPDERDRHRLRAVLEEHAARQSGDTAGDALGEAREAWARAASAFAAAGETKLALRARLEGARVLDLQGFNEGAWEELAEVRSAIPRAAVPLAARAHYLAGGVATDMARIRDSRHHLEQAVELARACGDRETLGKALHNLGVIDVDLGNPARAVPRLHEAMVVLAGTRMYGQAVTRMTLGRASHLLGDPDLALERYHEALSELRSQNLQWDVGRTMLEIGYVHLELRGASEAALDWFDDALAAAREVGDTEGERSALTARGAALLRLGRASDAARGLHEALGLARGADVPLLEMEARIGLATALRLRGSPGDALEMVNGAIERVPAPLGQWALAQALRERSEVHRALGDLAAARVDIRAAIDVMEDVRTRIPHPLQRTAFFGTVRPFYERWIELELEAGEPLAAFRASERARARTLREAWREVPAAAAGRGLAPYREALAEAQLALVSVLDDPERRRAAEAEVSRRYEAFLEAEGAVLGADPRRASLFDPEIDLDRVARSLPPNAAVVSFVLSEPRSTAFRITAAGVAAFELPGRDAMEAQVDALAQALTTRQALTPGRSVAEQRQAVRDADVAVEATARALGDTLSAPLGGSAQRLWIVPDGALHRVPLGVVEVGGSTLLERAEVSRLPAVAVVGRTRAPARRSPRMLVVADPVLRPPFARLPHARDEALAIAGLPGARVDLKLGVDASPAVLHDPGLAAYDVVHFATHGVVDRAHPAQSSLVLSLADASGAPVDGFVRLHQVLALPLDARLVTLSACSTGVGRPVAGEGVLGLSRAFLHAGSDRVLSTLWQVPDQATAQLMADFYRRLIVDGQPAAAALRGAQRSLAAVPRWSAPYFWAGFIVEESLIER